MAVAEKLSITLTPEMVKTIKECVDSGEYASVSEVLRDAMRSWQRTRHEHAETLASIKARIKAAIEEPGVRTSIDDLEAELQELRDLAVRGHAA